MEGELEAHLQEEKAAGIANRRNGKVSKKIKSISGEFELESSRDRVGSFEPLVLPKRQVIITEELEEKVIGLYGLGLSTRDISKHKVREGSSVITRAVYNILGVSLEGKKELLGMYLSESEGAKFWLAVLTDLKNRGMQDMLIACVDGLKGFPEATSCYFSKNGSADLCRTSDQKQLALYR